MKANQTGKGTRRARAGSKDSADGSDKQQSSHLQQRADAEAAAQARRKANQEEAARAKAHQDEVTRERQKEQQRQESQQRQEAERQRKEVARQKEQLFRFQEQQSSHLQQRADAEAAAQARRKADQEVAARAKAQHDEKMKELQDERQRQEKDAERAEAQKKRIAQQKDLLFLQRAALGGVRPPAEGADAIFRSSASFPWDSSAKGGGKKGTIFKGGAASKNGRDGKGGGALKGGYKDGKDGKAGKKGWKNGPGDAAFFEQKQNNSSPRSDDESGQSGSRTGDLVEKQGSGGEFEHEFVRVDSDEPNWTAHYDPRCQTDRRFRDHMVYRDAKKYAAVVREMKKIPLRGAIAAGGITVPKVCEDDLLSEFHDIEELTEPGSEHTIVSCSASSEESELDAPSRALAYDRDAQKWAVCPRFREHVRSAVGLVTQLSEWDTHNRRAAVTQVRRIPEIISAKGHNNKQDLPLPPAPQRPDLVAHLKDHTGFVATALFHAVQLFGCATVGTGPLRVRFQGRMFRRIARFVEREDPETKRLFHSYQGWNTEVAEVGGAPATESSISNAVSARFRKLVQEVESRLTVGGAGATTTLGESDLVSLLRKMDLEVDGEQGDGKKFTSFHSFVCF
eukprot:g5615.t1